MSATINPHLAAFAAEFSKTFDELLEKHPEFTATFAPVGVEVTTTDGLTARFYEEGIEFYPETKDSK